MVLVCEQFALKGVEKSSRGSNWSPARPRGICVEKKNFSVRYTKRAGGYDGAGKQWENEGQRGEIKDCCLLDSDQLDGKLQKGFNAAPGDRGGKGATVSVGQGSREQAR